MTSRNLPVPLSTYFLSCWRLSLLGYTLAKMGERCPDPVALMNYLRTYHKDRPS